MPIIIGLYTIKKIIPSSKKKNSEFMLVWSYNSTMNFDSIRNLVGHVLTSSLRNEKHSIRFAFGNQANLRNMNDVTWTISLDPNKIHS